MEIVESLLFTYIVSKWIFEYFFPIFLSLVKGYSIQIKKKNINFHIYIICNIFSMFFISFIYYFDILYTVVPSIFSTVTDNKFSSKVTGIK